MQPPLWSWSKVLWRCAGNVPSKRFSPDIIVGGPTHLSDLADEGLGRYRGRAACFSYWQGKPKPVKHSRKWRARTNPGPFLISGYSAFALHFLLLCYLLYLLPIDASLPPTQFNNCILAFSHYTFRHGLLWRNWRHLQNGQTMGCASLAICIPSVMVRERLIWAQVGGNLMKTEGFNPAQNNILRFFSYFIYLCTVSRF